MSTSGEFGGDVLPDKKMSRDFAAVVGRNSTGSPRMWTWSAMRASLASNAASAVAKSTVHMTDRHPGGDLAQQGQQTSPYGRPDWRQSNLLSDGKAA
jgi:hypothetical protein